MKKTFFIITSIIAGLFLIFILYVNMLPTVDRTELPKEPVINDENSTAMICNPLAAIRENGSTYDLSDNTWIGLKISPTLQSISYIYFNGVNGRGAPNQGEWQNDKFARFSTRQIEIYDYKNYYYNNWQNDEWTFTLNRETLQGNAESFVGKYGWNFEYKDKWQCEIVEHTNLNLEAEKSIRIENERWQKIKELKKIEEEAQLEKNKI